jgi:hypothetical protein
LLYAPGFRLTLAGGRRPGLKCSHCESAGVFYGPNRSQTEAA